MRRSLAMIITVGLLLLPIMLWSQERMAKPESASKKVRIISARSSSLASNVFGVRATRTDGQGKQSKTEPPPDFVPYDQAPEALKQVEPKYPELARRAGIEGTVWVKILVDQEGKTLQASVTKSDAEVLNQSAIDAAMQWAFKPAMLKGKPVATWVSIPFRFKLAGYPLETRVEKPLITTPFTGNFTTETVLILIVLLAWVMQIVLAVVALIGIVRSRFPEPNDKLVWTIIAVFLPIIGPILYFVVGRRQRLSPA